MYKVKRLAIRLGRKDLPTCFSIECQVEVKSTLQFWNQGDGNPQTKTIADVITFPHHTKSIMKLTSDPSYSCSNHCKKIYLHMLVANVLGPQSWQCYLRLILIFRWFKFRLVPPYSRWCGKFQLAIWDTPFGLFCQGWTQGTLRHILEPILLIF